MADGGPSFERLKKEPAYLKVYGAVEERILSGALAEGEALPTEAALCEQFGVTRATVREGLRLLEKADLLKRGAAKRFYVKRPDAFDVAAMASRSLTHGGATFREVFETLSVLYPQAGRLAAKRFSDSAAGDLQKVRDALGAAPNEGSAEIVSLAVAFFEALAAGLGNRVLLSMLQSLNLLIGASLLQVIDRTPRAKQRIYKAQSEIISAIEVGDADRAALWLAKHIDDLKRGYKVARVDLDQPIQ